MDLLTAVLLATGAALLTTNTFGGAWSILLVTGGFYGVHRVVRSKVSAALLFAPMIVWAFERFWLVLPSGIWSRWQHDSPLLYEVPAGIGVLVFSSALATSVLLLRARAGRLLAGLTTAALAIGFVAGCLAHLFDENTTPARALDAIERGWEPAGVFTAGLCWLSVVLAPKLDGARVGFGAWIGAIGAMLLCAVQKGVSPTVETNDALAILLLATSALAWICCAIGLGSAALAGARWAGWVGVGLVVLQVLSIPAAIAFFSSRQTALALSMSTGFGALGFAVAVLFGRALPFREPRLVTGGLFLFASSGSLTAWARAIAASARVARFEDSPSTALQGGAFTAALLLWAALLALHASPPDEAR